MEPINCIDCGTELYEGAKYCTNCGRRVANEPDKEAPEKDFGSGSILESNHRKLKSKKRKLMIMSIFGSIIAIYGLIALTVGNMCMSLEVADAVADAYTELFVKGFIFLLIGFSLAIVGFLALAVENMYKKYFAIISNNRNISIDQLAIVLRKPVRHVKTSVAEMIKKGYFPEGTYIDPKKNRIVYPHES